uniref:Kazal-like domain-containing protein n=1 Tax=Oryzias sinensis TaxID=183150 RepID=A0A8C7YB63_9TELE
MCSLHAKNLLFCLCSALKDPCAEVTCSYGSTCVQSSDGLAAKCMCPLGCDGKAGETVCGSDGNDYRSECELHQHACKNQKNIRLQHPGPCGESTLDRGSCSKCSSFFISVSITSKNECIQTSNNRQKHLKSGSI